MGQIYMNYNDIPGDATAEGHEKWIELNSCQWGVGRGISSPTGGSADRESSAPSVSEIVVTKATDVSSTKPSMRPIREKVRRARSTSARPTRGNWRST